jgi:hypothetical protein
MLRLAGSVQPETARVFGWAAVAATVVGVLALIQSLVTGFEAAGDPFAYANQACVRPQEINPEPVCWEDHYGRNPAFANPAAVIVTASSLGLAVALSLFNTSPRRWFLYVFVMVLALMFAAAAQWGSGVAERHQQQLDEGVAEGRP